MSRDITQLHPTLQIKIAELKKLCEQQGLSLGIGECFRTVAEQDSLYAQGRTKAGKIVTNAKGSSYSSQHQWGIAFDFFKNVKGQEYSDTAFFEKVASLAKSIGLAWGGDWKSFVDKPHLYLPEWGDSTTKLKKQYGTPDKFKATWKEKATLETANNKLQQALGIKEGNATLKDANSELKEALGISENTAAKPQTAAKKVNTKVLEWQQAAIKDGFKFPKYGADGEWGSECETVAKEAVVKRRTSNGKAVYKYPNLTKIVQKAIGFTGDDIDGKCGNDTREAIIKYQKNHGLTVDGCVGLKTWKKILGI